MSRYAEVYKNTKGPGDARPTALQIVEDEGYTGKLTDKVFLVTGVSSGIGVETLRALYATGGHVFGTVRDVPKGQKVVEEIKAKTKGGKITLLEMRNDSLASVKEAAAEFLKQSDKLNIIINNAGVMTTPEGKTEDGFETQFGINHVAHFLLFWLLKDTLLASSTPDFPSRVVAVASYGHRSGKPRLHDYNFTEPGSYTPGLGYGQAKTANIWFSNELERRYGSKGLHSTSLHPGGIWTGLQIHMDKSFIEAASKNDDVNNYMMNTEQGAATQVYAALGEEWKNKGGKYLSKCQVADHVVDGAIGDDGYEDWAYDEQGEKQLWKDTLKMLDLKDDQ
ncbi:NAD(P)-binding protein [Polychaeton citri CBS 116435]|uniref:NAD(P)-binding protein n=1 Tax=Polychaeton citri CBS 116435 TaxID=1314669 RepID=A0A9P4ULM5_9PEZI|nr:NAD(P)-binding protein [Polychaeton citri CBS 116435]